MVIVSFCPTYGGKEVGKVVEDWSGNFMGQSYTVPQLAYVVCRECGEKIYDKAAMQKIQQYSPAYENEELLKLAEKKAGYHPKSND